MPARLISALAVLVPLVAVAAVEDASPAEARANLVGFQRLVHDLSSAVDASRKPCIDAEARVAEADAALVALDLSDSRPDAAKTVRQAIQGAKDSQEARDLACERFAEAERQHKVARGLLRDSMLGFEGCLQTGEAASAACGKASGIARQQLQATRAVMGRQEAFAAAKDMQAKIEKLKDSAKQAFKLSDKAISKSMAAYGAADDLGRQAALMANATNSYEEAVRAQQASEGVQALSNQFMGDVLAVGRCPASEPACDALRPERLSRAKAVEAEIRRRTAESEGSLTNVKLAAFKVEADSLKNASAEERLAALRFLQLVDNNPDVRSLFGGEAVRFSAGKKGSSAAIRIDLDRIIDNPGKDASLIVTAPVGNDSSSAIYSSEDGITSGIKATLAYRFTPRLFKSDRVLDRLFQFGVQATVGFSAHSYRSADDIGVGIKSHSTPWSLGGQLIYANAKSTWLHQLGVDYAAERRFADGVDKTTRCPAVPAGQLSARCVNAYFEPPTDHKGWEFNYTLRFKLGEIALAPSLTYESRTNVKTLAVPVYLIGDVEKKALSAGVGFGHSSAGRDGIKAKSEIRVFVSSPFSLAGE